MRLNKEELPQNITAFVVLTIFIILLWTVPMDKFHEDHPTVRPVITGILSVGYLGTLRSMVILNHQVSYLNS